MIKKIIKACVCIMLIVSFNSGQAQIAANWEVGTWSQFKTSAVSYTLDDGTSNQLPVAIPLFDSYNYKVTMFTVTSWSPNWSKLLSVSQNGHEIASHTVSHLNFQGASVSSQDTECKNAQSTINQNITNTKCVTIAYPNCNMGDNATISKYYIGGRTCSGQIASSSPSDFYTISSIICGSTGLNTAQALNDKIAQAKSSKGWCVLLFHGFNGDGGYSPIESSEVNSHLTYVKNNAADYWVATFGNAIKYIKERNAASLTETAVNADSLSISLTDNLDNSIYNTPITVRRVLPSGWTKARAWQNNKLLTSSIVSANGKHMQCLMLFLMAVLFILQILMQLPHLPQDQRVSTLSYAKNSTAVALTASGTALKWYSVATGGTPSTTAPTPSTATVGSTTYYVTQTIGGVESGRASITVNVYEPQGPYGGTPHAIPGTIQFENFDTGGLDTAYSDNTEGSQVDPQPNFRTDEDVDLENCTDAGAGYNLGWTAAGEWLEYTVNVAAAGKYTLTIRAACEGDGRTVSLSSNGTAVASNLAIPSTTGWQVWQDVKTEVTLPAGKQVLRLTIGATDYVNLNYMSFAAVGTNPPTVTTPVAYCHDAVATALTATGTALKWYTAETGGSALASAPTPSTATVSSTSYYVSQTINDIESARAAIVVNVSETPVVPQVVTPVSYTIGETATALSATGTALKWYTSAAGGTAATTAPIPSTATVGNTTYYVSQTIGTCESARATISVTIKPTVVITISLKKGWNLIGCPLDGSTDIAIALSSIWDKVELIKNNDAFYNKSQSVFLNSLTKLNWSGGYLVKVSSDCELDWNVK
ncbi:MAG: carbohydrate-binding protein [Bacteroidales bacterium]|nr:carbohydrate-binding protein [Bacteroidales bacterium]